jgi:Ca2+-binding RTX toxin-like protein
MLGTDEKNTMFAKGRGDILKGFDASDFLNGDRGNDELYGRPAKDTLNGGPDNDVLEAGQGHDWYDIRENEWGNDHITDTALPDNDYLTGNTIAPYPWLTTNLTINLNSGSGPEVGNAAGTSTIDWSGNVIDNVFNDGGGNDEITGNDVANYILSREGADMVDAGPGDDRIYVSDGTGDDTVNCGEGSDTVENSDPGDELANCETVNPP